MISRLLLFEGPPGGGKSSISQFVAQQCQAAQIPVQWVEEHTLNTTIFAPFLDLLPTAPTAAVTALLAGWQQLVDRLNNSPDSDCLDGAFFHSSLKLLLAYDYDPAQIDDYLQTLYALLAPFNPVLIHLTGDVDVIVRSIIAERGDRWATNVAADVANYPCQQRLQQSGMAGLISFFCESQHQLTAIATTAPLIYHRLDTTARDWAHYQQTLCAWLELPLQATTTPQAGDYTAYVGTYQPPAYFPPAFNHPFHVELTADGLRLHMVFMRNFRLVAQTPDCFALAGRPDQLEFVRNAEGEIQGVIYPFVPDQRFFCEKLA